MNYHLLSRPLQSQPGWGLENGPRPVNKPENDARWAASHNPPGSGWHRMTKIREEKRRDGTLCGLKMLQSLNCCRSVFTQLNEYHQCHSYKNLNNHLIFNSCAFKSHFKILTYQCYRYNTCADSVVLETDGTELGYSQILPPSACQVQPGEWSPAGVKGKTQLWLAYMLTE